MVHLKLNINSFLKMLLIKYSLFVLKLIFEEKSIRSVGFGCEKENIDQGRSYFQKNIDISHCFFSRSSTYVGNGGVIYVQSGSYLMKVYHTMFYECKCSDSGGAINFISSSSYLGMICASRCSASSYYHFAYLKTSQMNQVEYLSISNCSPSTTGFYSIWSQSGYQRFDNSNSSMNNAYAYSSIYLHHPFSFTSTHCTFSNNKVSNYICLYFYSESGILLMTNANIVHNNSPSLGGVIQVSGETQKKMMYCIFQNNQNTLFSVYEGSLEISHSFIYHSSSFSTDISVSTTNNSFQETQTFSFDYSSSLICSIPSQSRISWAVYSVSIIVLITLLIVAYFYRKNAPNLNGSQKLEESLPVVFI